MISSLSHRPTCRQLAFAFVVAIWMSTGHRTYGQQAVDAQLPQELESDPVFQSWKNQPGVQSCGRCHFAGNAFSTDRSFSRQNELKFWITSDKHSIARRRVEPLTTQELVQQAVELRSKLNLQDIPKDWFGASNVLSRRICDKLGYDVADSEGYQRFRDNCLTCHGGYRDEQDATDFARDGGAQPGISCNYCHQIGRKNNWVRDHGVAQGDNWRALAPTDKADAGMRDLVSINTQASLCFDCHIGNRETNQFVTHEMYAAGHPPLPSIELQTFCEEMPQHWQTPAQLYQSLREYNKRDQYFQDNYPGVLDSKENEVSPEQVFWKTRKILIGALAAREKTVKLFVDSASSNHPGHWGDYSLYDCAACHHELRSVSQRQQRGFPGPPGRPRQHEWPIVLFERLAAGGDLFRSLESEFTRELTKQPFGRPADVLPVAENLHKQLATTLEVIERTPVTATTAKRMLNELAQTPQEYFVTYDSARQLIWAMRTIAGELKEAGAIDEETAALVMSLGEPETSGVAAKLPSGRGQFIYSEALEADLRLRAAYDPARLKQQLDKIHGMLAAAPTHRSTLVSRDRTNN